jgi:chromosome partitioning protein
VYLLQYLSTYSILCVMAQRIVIAVINYKGGTSKTTSAVYLAHALREKGRHVVLVDADPQASAMEWSMLAPNRFPFPVIPRASRTLYAELDDLVSPGVDAIVIDTPPLDQRSGVVLAAARVATVILAPVAPSPIEYTRLHKVRELAVDAADVRNGHSVPLAALLTRTVAHTLAARIWREQAESDGYWCLRPEVRFLQQFAQAYGQGVADASRTAYGDVADELLSVRVPR